MSGRDPHRRFGKRQVSDLALFAALVYLWGRSPHLGTRVTISAPPDTLSALITLPSSSLATVDIARMNLLCAEGLEGTRPGGIEAAESTLDAWAAKVRRETDRHQYRFDRNPGEFEGSEGYFKLQFLGVVLAEDFGVHYDVDRRAGPAVSAEQDGFFRDPDAVFLSGLLGPQRRGTCSSMPVLYVAVGRRLSYPLKLVTTKGHLFVRWEGCGERFNVEVTGEGLNRFPDAYYRQWPFTVTDEEVAEEGYLKSLSPAEELAVFVSVRGMCLLEANRAAEAADAFEAAARLVPGVRSYGVMAARCRARADASAFRATTETRTL